MKHHPTCNGWRSCEYCKIIIQNAGKKAEYLEKVKRGKSED